MYRDRPERDGFFSHAMNAYLKLGGAAWPPLAGIGYPMPSFMLSAWIRPPAWATPTTGAGIERRLTTDQSSDSELDPVGPARLQEQFGGTS